MKCRAGIVALEDTKGWYGILEETQSWDSGSEGHTGRDSRFGGSTRVVVLDEVVRFVVVRFVVDSSYLANV